MTNGTAPTEHGTARLNEGKMNSSQKDSTGVWADLIRDEQGQLKRFVSQVEALNYCVQLGWSLEQTIFEPHGGPFNNDTYSSFIFVLSKS